jgi:DNA-binding NarL/FixJ family response regulator
MKRRKGLAPIRGGETKDLFNTLIIFSISIFNVIDQLMKGQNILERILYTLPFLIVSFLIYNNKTSKITKSIIFLLLGILYHLNVKDPSSIGATSFFIIAFLQHINIKSGIVVLSLSMIIIVVRSTMAIDTPSQLITTIASFIFLYGNVYLIFKKYKSKIADLQRQLKEKHKSKPVIRNLDIIKVSEEDKAVLKMYLNGYDYAKISKFLNIDIKKESIRKKITRIRDTTECENDMQFAIWLYDIV